jgi:parvulin-like peptidyl-prolyl isomerase
MGRIWNQRAAAAAGLFATLAAVTQSVSQPPKRDAKTLVVVNGTAITEQDLRSMMLSRGVPSSLWAAVRPVFVERLIDDQLVREYLAGRKAAAPEVLLDRAVGRVLQQFRKKGLKPEEELKKLGLDEASLRRKLALPIAWNLYARRIIGDREIREQFKKRRAEFDGTRLRARQIVLKLPKDAAAKRQAVEKLDAVRGDVVAGRISFADAAKKHSTAPSRTNGGDVGFFAYRGDMPREIARVAFSLKRDEISKPFFTQFGVHILQVTARKPGQLSLEDARPEIFRQLAQERWNERVAKLRKSAKIERISAEK